MDQQIAQQKAQKMQEDLQNQRVIVDKNGLHIVLRGDQVVEEITMDGKSQPELMEAVNEAISQTKELAGQAMIKMVSE